MVVMDELSLHIFAGIRTRPDGCTAVLLRGEPPEFLARERHTFEYRERTCVERMARLASFVGKRVCEQWRPGAVAVATLSPGIRLRSTSVDRGHLDGVILLAARNAGVATVIPVSTVRLKRLIPLMRMKASAAMSAMCADLGLSAGRKGEVTRNQFELEAIGAALFAAWSSGVALPVWAQQPGLQAAGDAI